MPTRTSIGSGQALLLIEDDPAVRRSMQLLLQGQGFVVHSFASSTPALADPNLREAQVAVVDYMLPDGDGVDVIRRLRAHGWSGRAVLITAHHSALLDERAKAAGYESVVAKPFHDQVLLDALRVEPPIA